MLSSENCLFYTTYVALRMQTKTCGADVCRTYTRTKKCLGICTVCRQATTRLSPPPVAKSSNADGRMLPHATRGNFAGRAAQGVPVAGGVWWPFIQSTPRVHGAWWKVVLPPSPWEIITTNQHHRVGHYSGALANTMPHEEGCLQVLNMLETSTRICIRQFPQTLMIAKTLSSFPARLRKKPQESY